MPKSPLQLAKDFARFQGQIASFPQGDAQLLLTLDFWQEMRDYRGDAAYQSYFDEYLPLLQGLITTHNLTDLTLTELQRLKDALTEIGSEKVQVVALELAKKYFYVGAIEEGLVALESAGRNPFLPDHSAEEHRQERIPDGARDGIPDGARDGISDDARMSSPPLPMSSPRRRGSSAGGEEGLDSRFRGKDNGAVGQVYSGPDEAVGQNRLGFDIDITDLRDTNELTALQSLCQRAHETNHPLSETLNGILTEWQAEREAAYHDRACCLFVERDDGGRTVRGRVRTLTGHIELFGKSATTDEITFEGAIKTPDDPFVGVAYDACQSVRAHFLTAGLKNQGSHFYHAHYGIENSSQTITGDSIGLAFALLASVQLLRPEVLRLDRLLSGEVAFTGGVAADGRLTAVNDGTLYQKIERAFFSPVKYLVLPETNAAMAREHLDRLRQTYPRRHLHLITAERFGDVIEDHNIVRSEKVCIGEFVAKKAAKYGRMTKVQVPLLAVLAYLLLCLVYPKAWVGFDWNPGAVRFVKNGFVVYNSDSHELWRRSLPVGQTRDDTPYWHVDDLNGDDWREVLVMPSYESANRFSGWLFAYGHKGDSLFARDCAIRGVYPLYREARDSDTNMFDVEVESYKYDERTVIIAQTYRDYPDRGMIRFLDSQGNYLGWYINAGGTNLKGFGDFDNDGREEPIFFGYNQLLGCSALFVLSPDSSFGVSPPYDSPEIELHTVKRGNQLRYVMFPPTDLGKLLLRADYNHLSHFFQLGNEGYRASVGEADVIPGEATVDYFLDSRLRARRARLSDPFIKQRRILVDSCFLPFVPRALYEDRLRDNVTYWTGTQYVTEGQLRAAGK